MNKRGMQAVSGAIFVLLGCAALPVAASVDPTPTTHLPVERAAAAADPFPVPDGLQDHVAFWRNVFGVWRQNQVALHDMEHPALVYAVVDIPGELNDNLTDDQRDYVQRVRAEWEARLRLVTAAAPDELGTEERALRQRIVDVAGAAALAEAPLRLRAQRGVRERFLRGLARSGRYDAEFRRIFEDAGLPGDLAYLPHVESSFQNHARSSVGATGMWQFTRGAGKMFMKVNTSIDERLDPVASARGAARYLARAYGQLGDWGLAVTSYNHGIQGMARAKAEFGTDFARIVREYKSGTFGFASRNFYAEFLAARELAREPERYFPEGVVFEPPFDTDQVVLERATRVGPLAARYGVSTRELVALNPAWQKTVARGAAPIPAGVHVWLPTGTLMAAAEHNKTMLVAATRATDSKAKGGVRTASAVGEVHVVRRGDTLSAIAKRYKVDMAALRELNDWMAEPHLLRVGQKVRLRDEVEEAAADVTVHVVRKGDTASMIAANYGVSVAELLEVNQLTRRSVIRPGQRLGIPVSR